MSSSSAGVVSHEMFAPALCEFLRMGPCAALVIWIQGRCLCMTQADALLPLPSLALKGGQLPFLIPGQWKGFFYCLFQRQRAFMLPALWGRGLSSSSPPLTGWDPGWLFRLQSLQYWPGSNAHVDCSFQLLLPALEPGDNLCLFF